MAEQANSTALATTNGQYSLTVRDFDAAGKANTHLIPVPDNIDSFGASVMLRAGILKMTTWKTFPFPMILHAVLYADRMGLDIMAGDVYMAEEGRLSTTAGAKIRHAMGTNRIEGYEVEITEGKAISLPWKTANKEGAWEGPNYHAKVTVKVKGWAKPVVYEASLDEWFTGRNPNWRTRPVYMLRKNALGKALEEVAPMGVEADEAPPLAPLTIDVQPALTAAIAQATIESSPTPKLESKESK